MKTIFSALFLFVAVLATAQEFSMPLRVNSDTTFSDREPWMHVHNGSIYLSWVKVPTTGPGEAYFTRSDDGGRSFLPEIKATTGAKIPADLQRGAPFTIDTKGYIHMVWVEMRFHGPDDKMQPDVFYIRSTDNGMTWSSEIVVSDDTSKYAQDFPSLAADSAGNVFLSFLDSRERVWGSAENEQLYLRKSTDNGETWSPARRVNQMPGGIGGTCECCKQDIQAAGNGFVTIAFRSSINGTAIPSNDRRDIHMVRSTDYGETFAEAVVVQSEPWILSACPVSGPNTTLSEDGSLLSVWRDARQASGDVSHVYLAQNFNGESATVNRQLDVSGEVLPNWPDIAQREEVTAIVYETNNRGLQYILSSPFSLQPDVKSQIHFRGSRQQFVNVAFGANGDRYIAWQENRSGTNDIFFVRDTASATGAVQSESKAALRVTPNPVRAGEEMTITYGTDRSYRTYELVDVSGKIAANGKLTVSGSLTVPKLPNGSYLLRLLGEDSFATQMIVITN